MIFGPQCLTCQVNQHAVFPSVFQPVQIYNLQFINKSTFKYSMLIIENIVDLYPTASSEGFRSTMCWAGQGLMLAKHVLA